MDRDIYVPTSGPPRIAPPSPEIYSLMGQENIFAMLKVFYQHLGTSQIKHLFAATEEGRDKASAKSACFFVTLLGGPPLFAEKYGNPAMRFRHMPFIIDEDSRQIWMSCFQKTLEHPETFQFPAQYLSGFLEFLEGFSGWMVNTKSK